MMHILRHGKTQIKFSILSPKQDSKKYIIGWKEIAITNSNVEM